MEKMSQIRLRSRRAVKIISSLPAAQLAQVCDINRRLAPWSAAANDPLVCRAGTYSLYLKPVAYRSLDESAQRLLLASFMTLLYFAQHVSDEAISMMPK